MTASDRHRQMVLIFLALLTTVAIAWALFGRVERDLPPPGPHHQVSTD